MIISYKNYEIRPYSNLLCWEIWEKRPIKERGTNKISREDWVSMGKYPQDIGQGLHTIYELELKKMDEDERISIEEAIAKAEKLQKNLRKIGLDATKVFKQKGDADE